MRIRPLGLWMVVALALAPSIWPLMSALAQLGLKWLILILS